MHDTFHERPTGPLGTSPPTKTRVNIRFELHSDALTSSDSGRERSDVHRGKSAGLFW